ncbi:MAG: sodium/proton-translocating pyrophosphatase, partial [Planctomycetaceae bacterium]|nr:sodium/proton-translocating pyrophosphatase [Planctomycetaceae bacterium]
ASLQGKPLPVYEIPLQSGMSIGVMLICVELIMMLAILLFVPAEMAGACFLGFAIGESLGASALRIAGGIFTKIADIGSDLMKVVFKVKEDDPRNPGVIADCTGDNAGDSVGPTADGFETYGVTGVALIAFITLAVPSVDIQAKLIVWIFAMRFLMDFMSGISYFVNQAISESLYRGKTEFNFESPLTRLIWIASILCITTSFGMSWLLLSDLAIPNSSGGMTELPELWWQLATIISLGTLAAVLIPEFTKIFTSSHSKHVHEIVTASREGGSSLTILSGIVAGNFSAFWKGILIAGLMAGAYFISQQGLDQVMHADLGAGQVGVGSVFAFGLVAFGFLCMGPVTIAVDSYGPVTDNAQSVFELAQTEHIPGISEEIQRDFGFTPDFERGKHFLEANDSAGNTFKATAKPVLIGTAVVGATTMIFSIILLLGRSGLLALSLTDAPVLLGFICGGSVIFWFSGASMQAVTTGAYRAVEYIKKNMRLDKTEADLKRIMEYYDPAKPESSKVFTKDAYDNALLARDKARNALDAAEVQQKKAQSDVDKAELALSQCKIFAPISGTVVERNVRANELVNASTKLYRITDFSLLELKLEVPEASMRNLREPARTAVNGGQPQPDISTAQAAFFTLTAYRNPKFEERFLGFVDRVAPTVDQARGMVAVTVRVVPPLQVDGETHKAILAQLDADSRKAVLETAAAAKSGKGSYTIKPGMWADARVASEVREGVLVAPGAGLVGDTEVLWIISKPKSSDEKTGVARRVDIRGRRGVTSEGVFEILMPRPSRGEGDLREGDLVVVRGQTLLRDGQNVRLNYLGQ